MLPLRIPTGSCSKVFASRCVSLDVVYMMHVIELVGEPQRSWPDWYAGFGMEFLLTLFWSVFWSTEETNKKSLEKTVQRMGKEAVQWGLVAGVYTGMTYGMQEARGVHDWVCIYCFLWTSFPFSFHVDLCCREYGVKLLTFLQ